MEELEYRLAPSVGGGWISSTEFGQSGDGLLGQYYDNSALSGSPSFTRWDNRVDFSWPDGNADPGGSPNPSFASVGPDNWSAEWTGTLTANFSETYTFQINSAANGVRLWVAPVGQQLGNPIINDWTSHSETTDLATMSLSAGQDYNVELELSETNAYVQQIQLQWSSPSTPLEDIEPATEVGLNVDGYDALFANMVNGGTRAYWWVPGNGNLYVPTDSNDWPEADSEILLGEGDPTTMLGGSYLVQFTGMATVTDGPQSVDWWVNGTDLHSSTLQAGQGYNPNSNTTTATMVVSPSTNFDFYLFFTDTNRNPNSSLNITGISETGDTVTVSVPTVSDIAPNQQVTIAGITGSAASDYNGTYVITSVDTSNNTFTYIGGCCSGPAILSAGTATISHNGITNLYVMQPSTPGGNSPLPVGTLFTPSALSMVSQYTVLRFMGLEQTNDNLTSNWSDRTLVSDNFWSGWQFESGTGVETDVTGASSAGLPWEVQVALANEAGKDVYINIPINASVSYLTNLADLFAYGSNGVTPYTSVQSDPVWAPLNPNLKVYIEFSNEIWNYEFPQNGTSANGWANQLSQRALYDYLTNNQSDPLYPGGGNDAYSDGAILASYYDVNSTNDSAFLRTYNPNPALIAAWSPEYFSNAASINGYLIYDGWVGLRDVQISDAFKTAFGETNINAADTDSRVRPVFEWQGGGGWSGALNFISGVFGAIHPVSYYLYGAGGAWYVDDTTDGFSDVSFTNPAFADGLVGWSSTGSTGVASNGSSMGNPDAPPLFSAIAVTDGATESGNTVTITTTAPLNFVVGQSVTISGVYVSGYNGTFTITAVTPTTFTYDDTTTGLANSGDGIVTGNGPSLQTAYLQPGASISQNVTFSDSYADITLYYTQTAPTDSPGGLNITLVPINGGPAINNGQPIPWSEVTTLQDAFSWARSEAFYTGASDYTYAVTFTNTLSSGTVFLDNLAIQTVNGMFNETMAALPTLLQSISSTYYQPSAALALQYGLHYVGYEGGFDFAQNMSGIHDLDGYQDINQRGFSSGVPNVGMYANLDPRTEQLAIDSLEAFYAAGGTLAMDFESTGNINSWAIAAPEYSDWDTPKQEAVASVEQTAQSATYGLTPGQPGTSSSSALFPGQSLASTYVVPEGIYTVTVAFAGYSAPAGQTDSVEVLVNGNPISTENVNPQTGGVLLVPVGSLAAGQYSVEFINTAPSSNPYLYLGAPGTSIFTLGYTSATVSAVIAIQPPAGVWAGSSFGLTVDAVNALNQIDTSYNGSVTVSLANNPGNGTLGGSLTVQAVNGVAAFSGLTISNSNPGLAYTLQVSAAGTVPITTSSIEVSGYQLVANGANENLVWSGTSGSDQVQFTQTAAGTVRITASELGGIATSLTATVTGVTGDVVVNEYDVAGDADVINCSGLTTISSVITVGDGNDTLIGGGGANTIVAGNGANTIYGNGNGNSHNSGVQDPSNTITVGSGNNIIYGNYSGTGYQGGDNTITAGDGNNIIYGNYGNGSGNEGNGISLSSHGADGSDNTITVGNGDNIIYGNYGTADGGEGGSNTIVAGNGNDIIDGNAGGNDSDRKGGNNFIQVGNGNDTIYGNLGGDGGEGGNNTILTGSGQDAIYGNFGGDGGEGGDNLIVAGGGNDTIYAHCAVAASGTTNGTRAEGRDLIIGGSGADTVYGWPSGYALGTGTGDLFLAGTTNLSYRALNAVSAEWDSSDSYATRVADLSGLNGPVGANGGNYLISGTTVFASTAVAQIYCTADSTDDWYLVTNNDEMNSVNPSEVTLLEVPLTVIVAQPPAGVLAGNPFGLTIDELNAQNQIDTSYNGSVTVSLANNPGNSMLGGTLTVQAVNGVATFSGVTISNPGLGYTLLVSATGAIPITTSSIDVAGYQLVANGTTENLVWFGTSGSDQVQFTQTAAGTVQITVSELGGIATSFTATVTGVTGDVVVNEYDVAGDADVINCSGLTTISSAITVGNGNDTLIGGGGANTIVAGNGANTIYGNGIGNSPNVVHDRSNTITVGSGNNIIFGNYSGTGYQGGDNTITAGGGNNTIYGNYGNGSYTGDGAEGSDNTIRVGNGANTIYGNYGTADGGEGGSNTIVAGNGTDIIYGNAGGNDPSRKGGNNFIQVGNGNDTIYGNLGGDGGEGGNNTILTGSGQDTIYGNFGGDGGDGGNNLIVAGGGNDTIYAHCAVAASGTTNGTTAEGRDLIVGGSGAVTVYGWPSGYTLVGNGDLVVAGTTNLSYIALDLVLAEWDSSDSYATRVADLSGLAGPWGANGGNYLISGTTVVGSTAVDEIFGTADSTDDWYLVTSDDVLYNVNPSEVTLLG